MALEYRRWRGSKPGALLLAFLAVLSIGHFRTFIKVNEQINISGAPEVDADAPTRRRQDDTTVEGEIQGNTQLLSMIRIEKAQTEITPKKQELILEEKKDTKKKARYALKEALTKFAPKRQEEKGLNKAIGQSQTDPKGPKEKANIPKTYGLASPRHLLSALSQKGCTVLDVRSVKEVQTTGIVRNSICQSLHSTCTAQSCPEAANVDKDKPVIVYCSGGKRAGRAKDVLHVHGVSQVLNAGGYKRLKTIIQHSDPKGTSQNETQTEATTSANPDAPTSSSSLASQADFFYKNHRAQMKKLFHFDNATADSDDPFIVWKPRGKGEDKFRGLLDHFDGKVHREGRDAQWRSNKYPYYKGGSLCKMAQLFAEELQDGVAIPHVAFLRLDENWGALSEEIPNKTTNWVKSMWKHWQTQGCTQELILAYLDHPYTRAIFTMQFQMMDHPKVHSLALGLRWSNWVKKRQNELTGSSRDRTQQLMISNKPRPFRDKWVNQVIANFPNGTVQNSYGDGGKNQTLYFKEMLRSKFILSPSGLGMDCYRNYEAMYLGTIPVLEHLNRKDGWYRTFRDLPVAWIDYYHNLSPEWLDAEYQRIVANASHYNYGKLTHQYWIAFIQSQLEGVTAESLGPPPMLPEAALSKAEPEIVIPVFHPNNGTNSLVKTTAKLLEKHFCMVNNSYVRKDTIGQQRDCS